MGSIKVNDMVMFMVWEDNKLFPCPFCSNGIIRVIHVPKLKQQRFASGSAFSKMTTTYSQENYRVIDDCPNCHASKEKIEKALNSGEDYKKPSRNKILERMKKSGLPTRI